MSIAPICSLRRTRRTAQVAFLLATVAVALAACDDVQAPAEDLVVSISPVGDTVPAGHTFRLVATVQRDGAIDSEAIVRWLSRAPDIVSVDRTTGVAMALDDGVAQIEAWLQDAPVMGSLTVTVARMPEVVIIRDDPIALLEADTFLVRARVLDGTGAEMRDVQVVWDVGHPDIATVDDRGVLTGFGQGSTVVTAVVGDVIDSSIVTVGDGFLIGSLAASAWNGEQRQRGRTCGLDAEGAAWCWKIDSLTATAWAPEVRFTQISLGDQHTCGVTAELRAYCAGANHRGQLGLGERAFGRYDTLVPVAEGMAIREIRAASHDFTCAVAVTDTVYCFGHNDLSQLGRGFKSGSEPDVAPTVPPVVAAHLSVTAFSGCALQFDASLTCWGWPGPDTSARASNPQQHTSPVRFASVSSGVLSHCGIATDAEGYCWGPGSDGELGDGTNEHHYTPAPIAGGSRWSVLSAGGWFACGIDARAAAYCWGSNRSGQLGDGTRTDANVPTRVMTDLGFRDIVAGETYACGITVLGAVYCWGGDIHDSPARVLRAPPSDSTETHALVTFGAFREGPHR